MICVDIVECEPKQNKCVNGSLSDAMESKIDFINGYSYKAPIYPYNGCCFVYEISEGMHF